MKLYIEVLKDNVIYSWGLLNSASTSRIVFEDEFILDVWKVHNHSYFYKAFFYKSKTIYSSFEVSTKQKLYCAIQNLLKKELYHVLQK